MISAGVDIGSLTAKAVILKEGQWMASTLIPTGPDSVKAAEQLLERTTKAAALTLEDLDYIVATGYGRVNVPFAHKNITEISCHAKGTSWFYPDVRTILDMGGQDCKAIRINKEGKITDFVLNDKCAAGSGRYLERIARLLEVGLDDVGPRSLAPVKGALPVDNLCVVFGEDGVLGFLRAGEHVNDILAGAADALTSRILSLLRKVGVEEAFSISGGVAKNVGIVKRLEERLGITAFLAPDPQMVGAVGAALFAEEMVSKEGRGTA
ncbi:MAG: acyl-CoA dehydratase activase [Pseudomonadota bacterium]